MEILENAHFCSTSYSSGNPVDDLPLALHSNTDALASSESSQNRDFRLKIRPFYAVLIENASGDEP